MNKRTNITPQKNRKSNIRNPRKFKIRDTFLNRPRIYTYMKLKLQLLTLAVAVIRNFVMLNIKQKTDKN